MVWAQPQALGHPSIHPGNLAGGTRLLFCVRVREGCLLKGGRGSTENEASLLPEGLEGDREEEEVDKACVATPRAKGHLHGAG